MGLVLGAYGFMPIVVIAARSASGVRGAAPAGFVAAFTHTLGLIKAVGSFPLHDGKHWSLFLAQIIMPALAFVSLFKLVLQNIRRDARVLWAQRPQGTTPSSAAWAMPDGRSWKASATPASRWW